MANSELLGARHTVQLPTGTIEYAERGTGAPVVFVHGLLVNADLWRNVVPAVADAGFRCLAPDWPLGSHTVPMPPAADLSPPGVARLIAEFLDALDLRDVTIVANDTGGALVQLLMTSYPERLGRVVLTPCDAFEYFFPPGFALLPTMATVPGAVWLMTRALGVPAVQRSSLGFGMTARQRIPASVLASYVRPAREVTGVRRDLRRFLRGVHRRYTLAAAERLPGFTKSVLLVGADGDRIFPAELADRLARLLPDSRQVTVADSYTFIPEDQPAELAKLVVDFMSGYGRLARVSQEDRSRATRVALVSTARRLFAERGYADVPANEIVSTAGLTRGALYHHYSDKRDLFRAVFMEVETELSNEIRAAAGNAGDVGGGMFAGLDAYLSACERPEVVRIVLTDAPAVLGWQAWREIETEHGLGLLTDMLEQGMAAGFLIRQPVRVLAQLLFSALTEAALLVANAGEDRATVRAEVRQGLVALFAGLAVPG